MGNNHAVKNHSSSNGNNSVSQYRTCTAVPGPSKAEFRGFSASGDVENRTYVTNRHEKSRLSHLRHLNELRRRSVPSDIHQQRSSVYRMVDGHDAIGTLKEEAVSDDYLESDSQNKCTSAEALSNRKNSIAPKIQINGRDSKGSIDEIEHSKSDGSERTSAESISHDHPTKQRAQKTDSRKITARKRLGQQSEAVNRRTQFLSFGANFIARSLDEAGGPAYFSTDLQLAMKPLSARTRSMSPLKQMRTYSSHKSMASEESILSKEHCDAIRKSWKAANERISTFAPERCFGFFVLDRVFEKAPPLKELFNVSQYAKVADAPEDHPFTRHTRIFNSIIDLSVRNVDVLETEIAPVLFTYGKRHYQSKLMDTFNEESVRMFCGQVICTLLDLLGDELTTEQLESWIEMMRYCGRALLNGFEYERLANTKKISINTKQHAYFVL